MLFGDRDKLLKKLSNAQLQNNYIQSQKYQLESYVMGLNRKIGKLENQIAVLRTKNKELIDKNYRLWRILSNEI